MSDIDLLAALLHESDTGCAADRKVCDPKRGSYSPHNEDAARLIAAGVTLAPRPAPDATLDVDRLRKALQATITHPHFCREIQDLCPTCNDDAAAIAREYAALSDPVTSTDKQP